MVDLSSVTGAVQNNNKNSNSSSQTLSADMNTFLKLLTTQLKYQDPLDPMDTAEFTNQLVQYSSVEQSIQMNTKLNALLSLGVANLGAQAVSYIGKTAQVVGDVMPLQDGKAKATYNLDKDAQAVTIMVKDMNGKVVYTETGKATAGNHEFTWNGKDANGIQLEDGAYQIVVSPKTETGAAKPNIITTVFGKVTGVANDENGVYIGLGNSVTAGLGDIITMRDDKYFDSVTDGDTKPEEKPDEKPKQLPENPSEPKTARV